MKSKLTILITLFLVLSTTVFALDKEVVSITLLNGKQSSETNATGIIINIANNTEKSIKVLKWNTPLEGTLRADMFNVSIDNKKVSYVGIKVKRGAPTEEDYIIFQPKETKTINLDISNYYKMDSSGIYAISYKGSVEFSLADDINAFKTNGELELKKLKPTVKSMNLEFVASKKNYKAKLTPNFDGCTSSQITAINTAHTSAVLLAN